MHTLGMGMSLRIMTTTMRYAKWHSAAPRCLSWYISGPSLDSSTCKQARVHNSNSGSRAVSVQRAMHSLLHVSRPRHSVC